MSNQDVIDLRWILTVIRQRIGLIIGLTVLAGVAALIAVMVMPLSYDASATLMIEPARNAQMSDLNVLMAGERLAITYGELVKGRPNLEAVIAKLGLKTTPEKLAEKITITPIKDTQLLTITVRDNDPKQAALMANTLADVFTSSAKDLQTARYADSLKSAQAQVESMSGTIQDTQAKIDALNTQKVKSDVELAHLNSALDEQRNNFRMYQQNYQSMQLSITSLLDNVKVLEAATVSGANSTTASTTLLVGQTAVTGGSSATTSAGITNLAETYAEMVERPAILQSAIAKSGLSITPEDLARRITLDTVAGTDLIRLSVTDQNQQNAILLANSIAEVFIGQFRSQVVQPYTSSLADLQAKMDEANKQIDQSQASIQTASAASAQAAAELSRLDTLSREYRNDLRTFQQDYDTMRMTAAQAADNVLLTASAPVPVKPVQSRLLYVVIAAMVGLIVGFVLSFVFEATKSENPDARRVGETVRVGGH